MGKPLSLDLRRRIVAFPAAGHSCRTSAAKCDISPGFVIALMKRYLGPVCIQGIPKSAEV
jgi:transposase